MEEYIEVKDITVISQNPIAGRIDLNSVSSSFCCISYRSIFIFVHITWINIDIMKHTCNWDIINWDTTRVHSAIECWWSRLHFILRSPKAFSTMQRALLMRELKEFSTWFAAGRSGAIKHAFLWNPSSDPIDLLLGDRVQKNTLSCETLRQIKPWMVVERVHHLF